MMRVKRLALVVSLATVAVTSTATNAPPPPELDCLVEPRLMVALASGSDGVLERVDVDRGDAVEVGQVVAVLESGVERAAVELASARAQLTADIRAGEASLRHGQRKESRYDDLFQKRAVAELDKDEVQTQSLLAAFKLQKAREDQRIAELQLRQAMEVLSRRTIRSPIRGVVVDRLLSPGESVEDRAILRLAQIDPLHVEVLAPVSLFGQIRPGMQGLVVPEEPVGGTHSAKVTIVDPVMDAASGTFRVRLELPNPGHRLPSGLKCKVRIVPASTDAMPRPAEVRAPAPDPSPGSAAAPLPLPAATPAPAPPATPAPAPQPAPAVAPPAREKSPPPTPAAKGPAVATAPGGTPGGSREPAAPPQSTSSLASRPAGPTGAPAAPRPSFGLVGAPALAADARAAETPSTASARDVSRGATPAPEVTPAAGARPAQAPAPLPARAETAGVVGPSPTPAATVAGAPAGATSPAVVTARPLTLGSAAAPASPQPVSAAPQAPPKLAVPEVAAPTRPPLPGGTVAAPGAQPTGGGPAAAPAQGVLPVAVPPPAPALPSVRGTFAAAGEKGRAPEPVAAPAKPTPRAPVVPARPPVTVACATVGPLPGEAAGQALAAALGRLSAQVARRTDSGPVPRDYMVLTPRQDSWGAVQELMQRLRASDLADLWPLRTGEHAQRVSLGVYSTKVAAERRSQLVAERGFAASVVPRMVDRPRHWLDVRLPDDGPAAARAKGALAAAGLPVEYTPSACPPTLASRATP
jgi:RND family efflux transporter MFP subunit